NSVAEQEPVEGYPASEQGQAKMIREVIATASAAGASGVFYWEGAWIPVGDGDEDLSAVWEQYGSGWASSYASDYDPEDAGLYYGGSSWDNQAFFDFEGHPLSSMDVWSSVRK
ncbi:MAG: glycosyl hydrolase 53 family protein, partial [Lachnospiraceae bacterium]|nr:glycosyl hydrolase 53 family protein [Lachnospiraceae bacterium]